jgi:FkbM family methyltransferase
MENKGEPGAIALLEEMLRVMKAQLHLQRVALLDAGHILRFNGPDMQRLALSLPDAADDFVQGTILQTRGFYEAKILGRVRAMGIVGPGSVVCDIGANIGNHTVYFAAVMGAGRVIAFEPQAHCHGALRANIALNGLEGRVSTHQALVGAENGRGRMVGFSARNLGGTTFAPDHNGVVPMLALDGVLSEAEICALHLVKIDVEGMQMEVLRGAAKTLEARKPAVWVEILERGHGFDVAAAYLAQFGYEAEKLSRNDFLFRVK